MNEEQTGIKGGKEKEKNVELCQSAKKLEILLILLPP
jgi:hypothetical protein